jgi:ATP/ADP translocase
LPCFIGFRDPLVTLALPFPSPPAFSDTRGCRFYLPTYKQRSCASVGILIGGGTGIFHSDFIALGTVPIRRYGQPSKNHFIIILIAFFFFCYDIIQKKILQKKAARPRSKNKKREKTQAPVGTARHATASALPSPALTLLIHVSAMYFLQEKAVEATKQKEQKR